MTEDWEKNFIRLANQVLHSMQDRSMQTAGTERAPIVRLVNELLEHAVDLRASDLHIDPQKDALHFRYRIDGLLYECHAPLSLKLQPVLTSRLKIMAKMERRIGKSKI